MSGLTGKDSIKSYISSKCLFKDLMLRCKSIRESVRPLVLKEGFIFFV